MIGMWFHIYCVNVPKEANTVGNSNILSSLPIYMLPGAPEEVAHTSYYITSMARVTAWLTSGMKSFTL